MISLAFESFWLWFVVGVVLWSFLGLLTAAWHGMPLVVGLVTGALFWFTGVAVLLIVGSVRRHRRSAVRGPDLMWAPVAAATPRPAEFSGGWPTMASGWSSGVAVSPSAGTGWPSPSPSSAGGWPGAIVDPWATGRPLASESRPIGAPGRLRPALGRVDVGTVAVALGVMSILVSIVLPWGEGSVIWSQHGRHSFAGGVSPSSAGFVGLALFLTGAVVAVAAGINLRRSHPVWPAVAAVVVTWWFCLGVECLLIQSHMASVASTADHSVLGDRASVSVSTAVGLWVMLIGCCVVYGWCGLASTRLIRPPLLEPRL